MLEAPDFDPRGENYNLRNCTAQRDQKFHHNMLSNRKLQPDSTSEIDVYRALTQVKGFPVVREPMNKSFSRRLNRLIWEAIEIQYNLACLSTLGGAYHLCNNPETALVIAIRQEMFARKLGSTSVIIRSQVFQAVNLGLLGKPKECAAMFRHCSKQALQEGWTEMSRFVEASRKWLEVELDQKLLHKEDVVLCNSDGHQESRDDFPVSVAVQELI